MKYGYSVYSLDEEKVIARVAVEGANYYKIVDGKIAESYEALSPDTPLLEGDKAFIAFDEYGSIKEEYYITYSPLALHKYEAGTTNLLATDYFGGRERVREHVDSDVLDKFDALPHTITYYSNKAYGRIVGILEEEWLEQPVLKTY